MPEEVLHPFPDDAGVAAAGAGMDVHQLMQAARDPGDRVTQALGGVLAQYPLHGLSQQELARLCERYFPGLRQLPSARAGCAPLRADEIDDVLALLLEHRRDASETCRWLAHALATACLGANHLYQDLGLPHRGILSVLMQDYFPALFARNTGNMKWKKFFYKQLCERAELQVCKAPSCKVCIDYKECFAQE